MRIYPAASREAVEDYREISDVFTFMLRWRLRALNEVNERRARSPGERRLSLATGRRYESVRSS
jgi:hypothetical protein